MAEPFKNVFDAKLVAGLAGHLKRVAPNTTVEHLNDDVKALNALELKARSQWITSQLIAHLPEDFASVCDIILAALHPEDEAALSEMVMDKRGVRGWAIMPLAEVIAQKGLHDPERSLGVLSALTKRFSAEFAIRPFIDAHPELTLKTMKAWAGDDNRHLRRLASEGCRPRLPWGMQLKQLMQDPKPILPILEILKNDPSDYVRKSVANNLNDISKDHPTMVLKVLRKWQSGADLKRQRLIKHALRTLIKKGDQQALSLIGVKQAEVAVKKFTLSSKKLSVGDDLKLAVALTSQEKTSHKIVLDYVVYHQRANGTLSPKVFKWKTFDMTPNETIRLDKVHSFKPVTTRRYYRGRHEVSIQINGKELVKRAFSLE